MNGEGFCPIGQPQFARPRHLWEMGMNAKDRLATLKVAVRSTCRNNLTRPRRPAETPAVTEGLQEQDRYRAERYLGTMRHRMPL